MLPKKLRHSMTMPANKKMPMIIANKSSCSLARFARLGFELLKAYTNSIIMFTIGMDVRSMNTIQLPIVVTSSVVVPPPWMITCCCGYAAGC